MESAILLASKIGWDLFFDSSDSEDDEEILERRTVQKNEFYFENVIPRFDDKQFKAYFRLTGASFEHLFLLIGNVDGRSDVHSGQPEITLEKQSLITLWYLANTECFR